MELEPTPAAPADRPVSLRAAALGLFVAWQLVYLPASNLLQFLPRARVPDRGEYVFETQREGSFTRIVPLQRGYEAFGHVVDRWSEVSGQTQSWQMFCPSLPPQSISPLVTLEFTGGTTETIGTQFPPAPFRGPLPGFRVQHLEANAVAGLWHFTSESIADNPEGYRDGLRIWAEARPGSIAGYLRHLAEMNRQGRQVRRATLSVRCRTKPADHTLTAVLDHPFVRLTFPDERFEVWDPTAREFVPVPGGAMP